MSVLRMIYLALAIVGALYPMMCLVPWLGEHGLAVAGLISAWKINAATTGLFWDLVISTITLSIWIIAETRVRKNWSALWAIPVTFLIGVGCGLPLYLFLRTRPIR